MFTDVPEQQIFLLHKLQWGSSQQKKRDTSNVLNVHVYLRFSFDFHNLQQCWLIDCIIDKPYPYLIDRCQICNGFRILWCANEAVDSLMQCPSNYDNSKQTNAYSWPFLSNLMLVCVARSAWPIQLLLHVADWPDKKCASCTCTDAGNWLRLIFSFSAREKQIISFCYCCWSY